MAMESKELAEGSGTPTPPAHDPSANESGRTFVDNAGDASQVPDGSDLEKVEEQKSSTELETDRRNDLVQTLARQYTQSSTGGSAAGDVNGLFSNDPDSPLNPWSEKFSTRSWASTIAKAATEHGDGFLQSGLSFEDVNVYGFGTETDYQKDVGNVILEVPELARRYLTKAGKGRRIDILRNMDGVVNAGEMLVVLGPPGAGCSTFLKSVAGEMNGIYMDSRAQFNYRGITREEMHHDHKGEAIYTAEVDVHFPMLSVGDTLTFAARARSPKAVPPGTTHNQLSEHFRDVVMAMYGISHTINTRVGNEYVRGVSGGERKRVTIAEATLSHAPLQCWDNSTRGLDSANAIEFCRTLRLQADVFGMASVVSIYQAPQSAYDLFDKVLLLYEGRQIFFGRTGEAKQFFESLGFDCPARQTTPDFLTSMTSPSERVVREGWEARVPKTPDDFAACWHSSAQYQALKAEIANYNAVYPLNGPEAEAFRARKHAAQARGQRVKSSFTLSYRQQVNLCLWRGFRRLLGDPGLTIFSLLANSITGLIVSSLFYNMSQTTDSFYSRAAVLFFAILTNAFSSALEILTQYAQRPIVEKQQRYGFYHPSAEAFSSVLVDMPYKVMNSIFYNLIIYFMTNLNRQPGNFFFFFFVSFLMVLAMSGVFRSIAALSRTLSQAMVPASILILAMVIFTGFVIPVDYMLGWCRWINYVDPIAYGFEALMINEFSGRNYTCNSYVPSPAIAGYQDVGPSNRVCTAVGSVAGQNYVNGDNYINTLYKYNRAHKWRDVGILIGFVLFNHLVYFVATEFISAKKSKGEVLVFKRGQLKALSRKVQTDVEAAPSDAKVVEEKQHHHHPMSDSSGSEQSATAAMIQKSTSVFHWSKVCYDIKIKGEPRRILDNVDGWVKPGTLTALMGVSGAGKTTLLDCLADRVSMGVITGEMLVDGKIRDSSFQRKTGYVQQQDLHLETTTVREALEFSALLRQPAKTPHAEKIAYVDEVIKLLDMQDYADAVVGVLGEGLNVEQRKRLTIGVELAAKPPLLLFVDEPTSGLDSQTSWAILDLLEKLSKAGQSILCTIHQPSAMLFQRFDRLLFLAKGGQTVYFGDIGEHSAVMTSYFEKKGAPKCLPGENPAEWMLQAIGAAPGSSTEIDWFQTWLESDEYKAVQGELDRLRSGATTQSAAQEEATLKHDPGAYNEFAAPMWQQLITVSHRVFQQYWRTPSYIYAKFTLCSSISLFIGLVFLNAPLSIQGLQNQMFAIFNVLTIFGQLVQQQMPHFVTQRSLYEVRERPSKAYSWKIFMLAQILVEIPWNTFMSIIMFVCIYYPVGFQNNAAVTGETVERGGLVWLLFWQFLIFTCTFAHACISITETAEAGGNLANVLFMMCLIFCGVISSPSSMPGFWVFMYRVSPFTYWVSAVLSAGLAHAPVTCAASEIVRLDPPSGQTCGEYLATYISKAGGYLLDSNATENCGFCRIASTDVFLTAISSDYSHRWRDFGIGMSFIVFNIFAALFLYWLIRVPHRKKI